VLSRIIPAIRLKTSLKTRRLPEIIVRKAVKKV
jgi:hypothetical protein